MEEKLISDALVDSVRLPTFPEGTLEGSLWVLGQPSTPPLPEAREALLTSMEKRSFWEGRGLKF